MPSSDETAEDRVDHLSVIWSFADIATADISRRGHIIIDGEHIIYMLWLREDINDAAAPHASASHQYADIVHQWQ
eukprot:scaffold46971_cov38-Prasinocladus_malaysianus.AAC.2